MKITTAKSDLMEAFGAVNRAVSSRSSIQVLSGVLLEAKEDGILLSGTDMEISIRTPVRGSVVEPGSLVLPARIVADIAKNLAPREVVIDQRPGENQVDLRAGESEFVLRVLPASDFPQLPVFPAEEGFTVDRKAFLETIDRVSPAASRDETRPVLTGVLINVAKNAVKMVATDSYRLSVKETVAQSSVKEKTQAIVPARALVELSRLGAGTGADEITVIPTENQILFQVGEIWLMSRLIDGQFPNYRQLVPETFEHEIRLDREEFLDVIKRVGLLAQKSAPIRLHFSAHTLTVSAQSQELGRAQESLPVQYDGDDLEIGFNPEFLEAGVAAIREGDVYLKLISPLRPGLIKGEADDFLYLIMPIRLSE
jgi:DNA polymerase-3 subunit beta